MHTGPSGYSINHCYVILATSIFINSQPRKIETEYFQWKCISLHIELFNVRLYWINCRLFQLLSCLTKQRRKEKTKSQQLGTELTSSVSSPGFYTVSLSCLSGPINDSNIFACQGRHLCWPDPLKWSNESKQMFSKDILCMCAFVSMNGSSNGQGGYRSREQPAQGTSLLGGDDEHGLTTNFTTLYKYITV